ncbi:MAG: hypothetical protein AAF488_00660 [Planctomycetota bacterium]
MLLIVLGSIGCAPLRTVFAPFGAKPKPDRAAWVSLAGEEYADLSDAELLKRSSERAARLLEEHNSARASQWAAAGLSLDPRDPQLLELAQRALRLDRQLQTWEAEFEAALENGRTEDAVLLAEELILHGRSPSISPERLLAHAWREIEVGVVAADRAGGAKAMSEWVERGARLLARHEESVRALGYDWGTRVADWRASVSRRTRVDQHRAEAQRLSSTGEFRHAYECYRRALVLDPREEELRLALFECRQRWITSILMLVEKAVQRGDWSAAHRGTHELAKHVSIEAEARGWSTEEVSRRHRGELLEEAQCFLDWDLPGCALLASLEVAELHPETDEELGSLIERLRGQLFSRPLVSRDPSAVALVDDPRHPLTTIAVGGLDYRESRTVDEGAVDYGLRRCGTEWRPSPALEADRRRRRELSRRLYELDTRLALAEPGSRDAILCNYRMIEEELERLDGQIRKSQRGRRVASFLDERIEVEEHRVRADASLAVVVRRADARPLELCIERHFEAADTAAEADPDRNVAGDVADLPSPEHCRERLEEEIDLALAAIEEEERQLAVARCLELAQAAERRGDHEIAVEWLVRLLLTTQPNPEQQRFATEILARCTARDPRVIALLAAE